MQIRYVINSITLVESFNHNFAFSSIILVATVKFITVYSRIVMQLKERSRSTLLHTLIICPFISHFHHLSHPQ